MPHYYSDILDTLNPNWRDLTIDVVTFPAPPILAKGRVYPEDSWRSDVLERGEELFRGLGYHVRGSRLTGHGPAFLIRRNLESLFTQDQFSRGSQWVGFTDRMYCATISSATILRTSDVDYAVDSIIEGVQSISQSCHPGSHTAVPGAPFLNAMFQVQTSKEKASNAVGINYKYASQIALSTYFPELITRDNSVVDELFKYVRLRDVLDLAEKKIPESVQLSSKLSEDVRFTVQTTLLRNEELIGRFASRERFLEFIRKVGGQHGTLRSEV